MRSTAVLARGALPFNKFPAGGTALEASADFTQRFVEIDDQKKNGEKGGEDTPADDAPAAMVGENPADDAGDEHKDDDEPFGSYGFLHGDEPP